MQFEYQINRVLHEEHQKTIAYLEKLETQLLKHGPGTVPDLTTGDLATTVWQLISLVEEDLIKHFGYEEEAVFPVLQAAGDVGITHMLTEEHRTILPIGERLMELVRITRKEGANPEQWQEIRMSGLELTERLVSHIQKEEMGLLPMIETLIDEEQDSELSNNYLMTRQ